MPIYEYRCEACGHEVDALQKISDAPLTDCTSCGESRLKRLISAPSFRLKGAGWYETDFKSDKDRKRNLAESGDGGGDKSDKSDKKKESGDKSSGDAKKSDAKSDTRKPASKSKGSGTEAA